MRFNKLVPELTVTNFPRSLDFYTKILGFSTEYQRTEPSFAFLSYQGSQIMIQQNNRKWETGKMEYPLGRGINLQIEVDDISVIADSLKKNNYPLMAEPQDNWYRKGGVLLGCREFLVQDPDGYLLRFSQDIGSRPVDKN